MGEHQHVYEGRFGDVPGMRTCECGSAISSDELVDEMVREIARLRPVLDAAEDVVLQVAYGSGNRAVVLTSKTAMTRLSQAVGWARR